MTNTLKFDDPIQAFRDAEKWLFTLITDPKGARYFQEKSMEVRMQEFREQIERMTSFLDFAGKPQAQCGWDERQGFRGAIIGQHASGSGIPGR